MGRAVLSNIMGFTLLCAVVVLGRAGYLAYTATPVAERSWQAWNPQLTEHVAQICNAAPYAVAGAFAVPIEQTMRQRLAAIPWHGLWLEARVLRSVAAIEKTFKDWVRVYGLPYAGDATSLQVTAVERIEPGRCAQRIFSFRAERARVFAYARPWSMAAARRVNDIQNTRIRSEAELPDSFQFQLPPGQSLQWPAQAELFIDGAAVETAVSFHDVGVPRCGEHAVDDAYLDLSTTNAVLGFGCMPEVNGLYQLVTEAPNLPLISRDETPSASNLAAGLIEASRIANALVTQDQHRTRFGSGPAPYLLGDLSDYNGPLESGVYLVQRPDTTLYAELNELPAAVWITAINGRPVYGIDDLAAHLIGHATSRHQGIEAPVVVGYFDGQDHIAQTRYYFNPAVFNQNHAGSALYIGFLDGLLLGQGDLGHCLGGNGLRLIGNLLSGLVEGLGSWAEDRRFDQRSLERNRYVDLAQCRWAANQRKAMSRQFESGTYDSAGWIAMPFTGGVRLATSSVLLKTGARGARSRMAARMMANGAGEALETVLWEIGSAPPGSPLKDRLTHARYAAGLGAAVGSATTLLSRGPG